MKFIEDPFKIQSNLLNRVFNRLDEGIFLLEEDNNFLGHKVNDLEKEVAELKHQDLLRTQKEIGGVLSVLLGEAHKETASVQMAQALSLVREMKTIEEVHEYCNSVLGSLKESFEHDPA